VLISYLLIYFYAKYYYVPLVYSIFHDLHNYVYEFTETHFYFGGLIYWLVPTLRKFAAF